MVRIRIDDSHLPHADMAMPLRFAKGCIASDRSVIPLAGDAIKTCRNLLESCPGEAAVHHLAGVIAFIHGNRKSAMAFFADAVALDPNYRYAAEALSNLIAADPGW
jgi:predicted Zn-dependent protease